jgi:hypothetical protein
MEAAEVTASHEQRNEANGDSQQEGTAATPLNVLPRVSPPEAGEEIHTTSALDTLRA